MPRKNANRTTLKNLADASEVMCELKDINTRLLRTQADADKRILHIQQQVAEISMPLNERRELLEIDLQSFAESKYSELFTSSKTVRTPYGSFGFRVNPPSVIVKMKKIADCVAAMKQQGKKMVQFLKISTTLDKNGLKRAYDEGRIDNKDLKLVGLAIESSEDFVYNTDEQEMGS